MSVVRSADTERDSRVLAGPLRKGGSSNTSQRYGVTSTVVAMVNSIEVREFLTSRRARIMLGET
jgi:hypothetical protein